MRLNDDPRQSQGYVNAEDLVTEFCNLSGPQRRRLTSIEREQFTDLARSHGLAASQEHLRRLRKLLLDVNY